MAIASVGDAWPSTLAPKVDFRHFSSQKENVLALSPDMSPSEAGRAILAFHWNQLLESESPTREGDNPEALHEMRVATRRLRAAMRDLRVPLGKAALVPFVEDIHWLAQLLGSIRDLDVFLQWLKAYGGQAPTAERPWVDRVIGDRQTERAQRRAELIEALDSTRYKAFRERFSEFVKEKPSGAPKSKGPQGTLFELASTKVAKQDKRILKKAKGANLKHLKRLHRLRIEFKRLRYTSEFFSSLYPRGLKRLIKTSTHLQDALGVVHDSDVQSRFLEHLRCAHLNDAAMSGTLDHMIRNLHEQERKHYREFNKEYRHFRSRKFQSQMKKRLRKAASRRR